MMSISSYDPSDELPSPSIEAVNRIINLPTAFDFNKVPTPAGMNPSNHSSLSSPPQSISLSDIFPFDDLEHGLNGTDFEVNSTIDYIGTTLPNNDHFDGTLVNSDSRSLTDFISNTSLGFDDEKLRIIAEPKAFYRERYSCETDPKKNRAQRYIRTEDGNTQYEYPTVKIPPIWCDPTRQIFIQVTPVTIKNKNAPDHCVHPYEIDTQENNVIKDTKNNSLYFRINENEIFTREKSFHISRRKMVQNELRSYTPFRLFGSDQPDIERVKNPQDAKQKIAIYQLWKSQLIFTIAERMDCNSLPIPILHTSVTSQIMVDKASKGPDDPPINTIKCIPQKGEWQGGDEVLIIMPGPIKRKVYSITFDFGQYGHQVITEVANIDTKTISFRTPSCPILPGDQNFKISIRIQENNSVFSPIDFWYMTPIKTTINICPRCQGNGANNYLSNKRRCGFDDFFEIDGGDTLTSQMDKLSIEKKTGESRPRLSLNEKNCKFDKYLNQLKDALTIFVRTNDPSRLFRRTRVLLAKSDENPPALNDAIQRGYTQLALSLIEQVIDMAPPNRLLEKGNDNGETPLLVAAKYNQWKLIEAILKNRSDLAEQKDNDGNNLFHLLANLSEDQGSKTIKNILTILSTELKVKLLKGTNKPNQIPFDIAQAHGNTQCIYLLEC